MNDKILNECIEISEIYNNKSEYYTDGKFDINKFKDGVNWHHISCINKLSKEFIIEFKDKVDWRNISQYQILSEEFIREFKGNVNWYRISYNQKLSEEFIREFKDGVNWYGISWYQILSEEFICEHLDKINIGYLFKNTNINLTKEFKNKIKILKMLIE